MRQIVYAMRFTGRATPAGPDGGVLAVHASAPGATLTSLVGASGLVCDLQPRDGGEATMTSEVTLTGATSFQEVGTITFGNGHQLRFSTVGSGYLGTGSGERHGAVTYQAQGGEGQFAGTHGLVTANLIIGPDLVLISHHLGVLFMLPRPGGDPGPTPDLSTGICLTGM